MLAYFLIIKILTSSHNISFFCDMKIIYQGIVILTSLLVVKMYIVLVSTISNSQAFLLKKKCELLLQANTFFSAEISAYMPYLMIKV